MMPRIEAGETLSAVNRAALTNNIGFEDERDRRRAIDALERRAGMEQAPAPARAASVEDLAAMGIALVMEEPAAPSSSAAIGEQEHG